MSTPTHVVQTQTGHYYLATIPNCPLAQEAVAEGDGVWDLHKRISKKKCDLQIAKGLQFVDTRLLATTETTYVGDAATRTMQAEQFPAWCANLKSILDSCQKLSWEIGDMLLQGENRFYKIFHAQLAGKIDQARSIPCSYLTAVEKFTGYDHDTLSQFMRVAKAFPPTSRLVGQMSWSHHQAVAALPETVRKSVIEKAAEEKLSVVMTRELVRATRQQQNNKPPSLPKSAASQGHVSVGEIVCLLKTLNSQAGRDVLCDVIMEQNENFELLSLIGQTTGFLVHVSYDCEHAKFERDGTEKKVHCKMCATTAKGAA
jgi:hypothetical protein